MAGRVNIRLFIADEWDRVEAVREAVARCVRAAYDNEEMSDALSMVAAELLENAVKYGSEGAPIQFLLDDDEVPTLVVTNVVEADSQHPMKLKGRIEWLRTFDNPADAYLATMAELYQSGNFREGSSGLGILRIAFEGNCVVTCDVSPHAVTVRARYQPPPSSQEGEC
jgi:hypothetical protein